MKMKALVVTAKHELELQELSMPKIGPYEALVKIKACGICSTTDRELIKGTQPYNDKYPCVLGHEAVGEIVELGKKAATFKMGYMVTRPTAIFPGDSRDGVSSAWGGFAEYGIVKDRRAMDADGDSSMSADYTALRQNVVPKGLDASQAVLAIALGETCSWLWQLPSVGGKKVCVSGTGIAGLSLALWSKLAGAANVTMIGRRNERLQVAMDLVADAVVNAAEVSDTAAAVVDRLGGKADFFFEAAGSKDMLRVGLASVRGGGTLAIYGVPPKNKYDLEWEWIGGDVSIVRPSADEHVGYAWAANLLSRGIIQSSKLMTHKWPLADYKKAFAEIGAGKVVKGMLTM